ncbi:MAG: hypothetical protein IJ949_07260, partial [Oscillospiraceae bacterium]|nr:hypothetical protein [Oscillospiraceae bacterium]
GKSGDQDWTRFNVAPVVMNWPSVKQYDLRPGFEALTDDQNHGYELSVAHLSLHEVVFDSIAFAANGDFSNAKTYDTFATTAKLLSNTGAEITVGNTNDPIVITYASDDESVARISGDGVITAVNDGTTKVRAFATVLGVPKTAEIEVTFSGLEVMFDRVDISVDTELDVGDTAQITAVPKNTDDSLFAGDVEIYFESTNTAVATVSKDGLVSARNSGETEINVYGIIGERREKTTVKITVNDTTPLETVTVSGSATVEKGFALKLSAQAIHESGSAADMDESTVVFGLAPGADESILSVTEDGVVTAKEVGEASVIATVTAKNGSSKTSDPFEIEVVPQSPKSKVFDFTKYAVNTSVLNQTVEDDGFEINRDLSSPGILSGVLKSCRYLAFGISSVVSATGHTKNADTVLDIKIDYDGWYEIDFKGALNNSGAGLAYIYMDGTYLGEYRFYNPVDQADVPAVNLNTIYLTAGTHQFTVRSMESGETGTMASHTRSHTISGITFRYLTEDPVVCDPVMTAERTSLAVGESVALDVQVPLSNGRTHSFGNRQGNTADSKSNLTVTSDDTAVVKYQNGKLIATGAGTANITAKALVYGVPSESTLEITVTDEKLTRVENLGAERISLYVGDSADIELRAFVKGQDSEEREIAVSNLIFSYELVGDSVAEVADGKLTATAVGDATLAVTATLGSAEPVTSYIRVSVLPDGFASATLDAVTQTVKFGGEGTELIVKAYDNSGKEMDAKSAEVVYTVNGSEIITVDENGWVTPGEEGVAEVTASVTLDGITHTTNTLTVSVRKGKVGSTYYTPSRVAAARENIKKYDWAKTEAETAIKKADKYLPYVETIYNLITNHT